MASEPSVELTLYVSPQDRALPMRLWLTAPDWLFRVAGFAFFALFTLSSVGKYLPVDYGQSFWEHFKNLGPWCQFADGTMIRMPWVPVLVDLTYLLITVSFIVRVNPKQRASDGKGILLSLLAGFAPLIVVVWLGPLLGWFNPHWEEEYFRFLWRNPIGPISVILGSALITVGNFLDVWGYLVLCRSFAIVPEARELKTTGPYRWVRHPVYLGQFLAQGGVWLFFARLHVVWIALYLVFVALQLYRSKLEERVLAQAFGEPYEAYRRRTFWFV
jgi:protein-S-isoprenylcysteine O-methyltransferase Ste14